MTDKKRKRMRQLTIEEISGVDKPAVAPGVVDVILKREEPGDVEKGHVMQRPALTTSVEGHSHLLDLADESGHTSYTQSEGDDYGHSHPFLVDSDGNVTIGEADGHRHDIEVVLNKQAAAAGGGSTQPETEATMAQNIDKSAGNDNEQAAAIEKLTKELETAKAFGVLTDAEKAHYQTLDEAGQAAFLSKSAEDRRAVIADIEKGNEVVYKGLDGTEYRRSDDARTVTLAKRLDEQVRETQKERAERFEADIRKRAETELANLPGELDAKVALLKAAESIKDEGQRKAAVDALKAQNAEMAKAMSTVGVSGGGAGDADDPSGELESLAKALAEKEGIDFYDAYDRVSESNPQIVNKALTGR